MKYAFFPGCVAKGGCPELYQSVMQVYPQLGIELEEMATASCTDTPWKERIFHVRGLCVGLCRVRSRPPIHWACGVSQGLSVCG